MPDDKERIVIEVSDETVAAEVAYGILGRANDIRDNPDDEHNSVASELQDVAEELIDRYETNGWGVADTPSDDELPDDPPDLAEEVNEDAIYGECENCSYPPSDHPIVADLPDGRTVTCQDYPRHEANNGDRGDRFYVCATCGRLKHEDLFEENDCTCQDCYSDGRSDVNWHEAKDGDGYVSTWRDTDE